ncbi:MAG: HDOD domain-containing protein [Burkholderiales bacterium]|nr:HDOD domain-containing protein [Burkholderiales bacterium]
MNVLEASNEHQRIHRFRLLQTLGQGAQGVVYLAHDPQLDRHVAIKTLLLGADPDAGHADRLLATAKLASSLSHPNIVPVFEAGMHAGQPYVVFEYVEGMTLAALLKTEGALPMARAVVMMSQILAGIAHVHANGLLHGDIKPANILIGCNGIPRVADFGISRRARAAAGEIALAGTVQYMAPESLRDGFADYRSDVFSLGLVFHEMLTGTAVFEGRNEYAQIYRILNENIAAPSSLNPRIDRRIDAIVHKALQREPAQRYAHAGEMKDALDRFRVPVAGSERAELKEQSVHSTVEFLLRRMALKSDFPALSASFNRINQLTLQADEAALKSISDLVMRDFALTQKLLRLVNSAQFGARQITRVSQAITLLGVSKLRAVAIGMMLVNGARAGPNCPAVAAALTDAFVAAVMARNIGRVVGARDVEELFICGMFSRLGQLLTLYYLKDEHDAIQRRMADEALDAATASRAVLGLSFDRLGVEVAKHWNFPEPIVQSMQPLPQKALATAASDVERMWHCAAYADELCSAARRENPAERAQAFAAHLERFAVAIPVPAVQVRALIGYSVEAASKYVAASELKIAQTPLLDGLRDLAEAPLEAERTEAAVPGGGSKRDPAADGPATTGTARKSAPTPALANTLTQSLRALF